MKYILTIWFLTVTFCSFANTIVVGKDKPITTLRQGIATAKAGDTILLHKGTYKEHSLIIDKSIHLVGVNSPVLDGEDKFEILTITGRDIVVKNIHFVNAGYSSMNDFAAIKIIDATNILVEGNKFDNTSFAIHISNSLHSTVKNNVIKGTNKSEHSSGNGIHLWKCQHMTIDGNTISNHRDGIYFEFVTE